MPPSEHAADEDEARLIARAKAGDRASQAALMRIHHGLIEKMMIRTWRSFGSWLSDADKADIGQEARMGFLKGIEKFDPARGFKLMTYASWWVFHRCIRYVHNNALQVRAPVHAWNAWRTKREYRDALKSYIREAIESLYVEIAELDDVLPAPENDDAEQRDLKLIRRAIRALHKRKSLSDRDVEIIMRRYTDPGETLLEIGVSFEVSRERIRQIEEVALAKIKFAVEHPASVNDPAISFHRISREKVRTKTQERAPIDAEWERARKRRHRTPTIKQTAAGRALEAIRAARGPKKSAEALK